MHVTQKNKFYKDKTGAQAIPQKFSLSQCYAGLGQRYAMLTETLRYVSSGKRAPLMINTP